MKKKKTIKRIIKTSLLLTAATITFGQGDRLVNIPAFNSFSVVHAQESEADALMSRINNLPPIEDIGKTHAEEVKGLMHMYSSLKLSERVSVTNYEILKKAFDELVKKGILTNEDNSLLQEQKAEKDKQNRKNLSDETVSQATEYTFESSGEQGRTIVIRYTTDTDGDGKGEQPTRIVLTGPDGKTYPVSNTSLSMSDGDKLKVDLTWTELYLQMDFSKYEKGKWTIKTSQAVTFSSRAFAGKAADVVSEDDKKKAPEPEPVKKSNPFFGLFIFVLIVVGAIFGIRKYISVMNEPDDPTYDEDDMEISGPKRMSDEETLAMMKAEHQRQMREKEMDDPQQGDNGGGYYQRDMYYNNPAPGPVAPRQIVVPSYDMDEPEQQQKQTAAPTPSFEMEDDDTGILTKEEKPSHLQNNDVEDFSDFT